MKRYFPCRKLLIIAVIFLGLTSCNFTKGSGNIITETRTEGDFRAISINGPFEVEVKKGNTKVVIEADDNLIGNIESRVSNGKLVIRYKKSNLRNSHFKVIITSPEIVKVEASAGADIIFRDDLNSNNNIELNASSGSEISTVINAPSLTADASSGAEINLSGRTRDFKANSSSAGDIKAFDLLSENTTVNSSSGASAKVHASVQMKAAASSGGSIRYRGGASVTKSETSGGDVKKD